MKRYFVHPLITVFLLNTLASVPVRATDFALPAAGTMVNLSPAYSPASLKGIVIHPDNALQFDFLIDKGEGNLTQDQKKLEYNNLIKYFLASLTVPDKDQWVNLSPYEKNRIIEDDFGKTEMGRHLLEQDYLLKQITSSLMYPESGLGKTFWNKVYERAHQEYGTTNIPVSTFNKVWIIPDKAVIYENGNTAVVVESHLEVMLEEDYLSFEKHSSSVSSENKTNEVTSKIIREVILPEIEKEVNLSKNFAVLRQIYSGMLLAAWYKRALKESFLGKIYVDRAKVQGVDQNPAANEAVYQKYLAAFKKGVYNYIKEDEDKFTRQPVLRKYFAGGLKQIDFDNAALVQEVSDAAMSAQIIKSNLDAASVHLETVDRAAVASLDKNFIDSVLEPISIVSEDIYYKEYVRSEVRRLFNRRHSQESFNLLLKELREFWSEKDLKTHIGLEFEDAVVYYLSKVKEIAILENNIKFLIQAPDSKELIARFGAELRAHLTNSGVFHLGNIQENYYIDNRLLLLVIEGLINHLERSDFVSNGEEQHDREVFLNLYLLLSLLDPNIYPGTTLEDARPRQAIPQEVTWSHAMDMFRRVFTDKFGTEEYLNMLIRLRSLEWVPEGAYLPWALLAFEHIVKHMDIFIEGFAALNADKVYGYRHPNVEREKFDKMRGLVAREESFKQKNDLFMELFEERVQQDKAMKVFPEKNQLLQPLPTDAAMAAFTLPATVGFRVRPGRFIVSDKILGIIRFPYVKGYEIAKMIEVNRSQWLEDLDIEGAIEALVLNLYPSYQANPGQIEGVYIAGETELIKMEMTSYLISELVGSKEEGWRITKALLKPGNILLPKSSITEVPVEKTESLWAHEEYHALWNKLEEDKSPDIAELETTFHQMLEFGRKIQVPGASEQISRILRREVRINNLTEYLFVMLGNAYENLRAGEFWIQVTDSHGIGTSTTTRGFVKTLLTGAVAYKDYVFLGHINSAFERVKAHRKITSRRAKLDMKYLKVRLEAKGGDEAMSALNYGGIDMNTANLDLQVKRDGKGVPLPLAQQDMAQISQINGFVPVIVEIKPASALPILGQLKPDSSA